jgi:hypothetical protein
MFKVVKGSITTAIKKLFLTLLKWQYKTDQKKILQNKKYFWKECIKIQFQKTNNANVLGL